MSYRNSTSSCYKDQEEQKKVSVKFYLQLSKECDNESVSSKSVSSKSVSSKSVSRALLQLLQQSDVSDNLLVALLEQSDVPDNLLSAVLSQQSDVPDNLLTAVVDQMLSTNNAEFTFDDGTKLVRRGRYLAVTTTIVAANSNRNSSNRNSSNRNSSNNSSTRNSNSTETRLDYIYSGERLSAGTVLNNIDLSAFVNQLKPTSFNPAPDFLKRLISVPNVAVVLSINGSSSSHLIIEVTRPSFGNVKHASDKTISTGDILLLER